MAQLYFDPFINFLVAVAKRFIKTDCSVRAEALTLSTLLTLVPFLTIFFVILNFFPLFGQFSNYIENFIFSHLLPGTGNILQKYFHVFVKNAFSLSSISMFFLLLIVMKMVFTVTDTFDAIWETTHKRSFLKAALLYGSIIILLPIFSGISLLVTSYINSLPYSSMPETMELIINIALFLVPFLLIFLCFFLLYFVLPDVKVKMKAAMYAALCTTLLFMIAKNGFGWYIEKFTSYDVLYGALSFLPIFIIWIYFSWIIILLGAIFTYAFQSPVRKLGI